MPKAKEAVGRRLDSAFTSFADDSRKRTKQADESHQRWVKRNQQLRAATKAILDKYIPETYEGFSLDYERAGLGGPCLRIWIRTVDALDHLMELHRDLEVGTIQVCYRSVIKRPKRIKEPIR
jgi:hypothetical protein